ncbi:MAG: twin-arginine translocation signal domain-containing protein [Acidobacteria bacterium]|nr:twin-arginine translocation signal domain-containing protein [Acidobacteriota bacterium]
MITFTNVPKHVEDLLEKWNGTASRRDFLKTSGLFVVSFGAAAVASPRLTQPSVDAQAVPDGVGPYPDPDFRQLDSWIVMHEDNTATFYVGKTDLGQGTGTAFRHRMRSRSTAGPCGAWLLKRGESCWRWHPRGLGCRLTSSRSATA